MFALLIGWAMSHATVFGQPAKTASPLEKVRAALDKNITLDFTGQNLTDVLNHFKEKTGIAINIDQMALMNAGVDMGNDGGFVPGGPGGGPGFPMQQIQVKAKDEKAGAVLRKLLSKHQLTYILFEDSVLVTTEDAGLVRQMRQRVSVDVDDAPFNKTVTALAKNHGINLIIDPKVAKQAESNVSLQLESTGIETAVRLLAELANLKAVRMGNVLFVTTEEKATKIRKEEQNQFDNPFNPNIPQTMPLRFGIGGGFGGIVPAQPRVAPALPIPGGVAPGVPPIEIVPPEKVVPDPAVPKNGNATPAAPPRPNPPAVDRPPVPAPAVGRPTDPPAPAQPQRP
jgi:hypothetical protein